MSRLDERFLDELKGRLRLSEVIGRAVTLKRQGREWVGLSPFAKEKTPSFFVNDDKGFWHDFSSGKHGDLIGFLQENERLTFREAVERLAGEAGLALPADDPRQAAVEARSAGLRDWLEEAARWYGAQLRRPPGEAARAYLDRRGLGAEDQARFGLGYAPAGRTALKDHLVARGARPGDLVDAGLLIAPQDGAAPYDRFRDRVMFPITDGRGQVVSFGGRALDPNARAKYLNGPETALFHKGRTLYGVPEARRLIHQAEVEKRPASLVVVEGYMDAIACARAGIAAVAGQGTALTEEQMEALWRLHPEPTLCFDGDAAGRRAADRAVDRALPLLKPGRSFRFAVVEGGKDPDEVLREQGAEALRGQLEKTEPFVARLFGRERDAEPLGTPESYAGLKVRLRKLAGLVADRDLAQMYKEALLDSFEQLRALTRPAATASDAGRALAGFRRGKRAGGAQDLSLEGATPGSAEAIHRLRAEPHFLAAAVAQAALRRPELIYEHAELLDVQGFGEEELRQVAHDMVAVWMLGEAVDADALERHLAGHGHQAKLHDIARAARKAQAPFLEPETAPEVVRALWSQALRVLIDLSALERAVASAVADFERDPDVPTLWRLKADRDAMRRAVRDGTVWAPAESPQ